MNFTKVIFPREARFIIASRAKRACITQASQGQRDFLLAINLSLKDKKWKEKVQKNAQLSFGRGREAFHQEIVRRGIQPCFLHDRTPRSVLKCNQGSEIFAEFLSTFCTLWPRQLRFLKGNLRIFKCFIDVL